MRAKSLFLLLVAIITVSCHNVSEQPLTGDDQVDITANKWLNQVNMHDYFLCFEEDGTGWEADVEDNTAQIHSFFSKRSFNYEIDTKKKRIAVTYNEDKKKVAESERELKFQQIKEMAFMMKAFGDLGPIVDEYIQGKIGGKEFYDYIMKARTNDMNLLNMAMSTEMLTQKEAFEKLDNILTSNRFAKAEQQLPDKNIDEIDFQEDEDEESDMEQKSFSDGDTL